MCKCLKCCAESVTCCCLKCAVGMLFSILCSALVLLVIIGVLVWYFVYKEKDDPAKAVHNDLKSMFNIKS